MQFSSCLYTTQGDYVCERQQQGSVLEGFYAPVMSPAVITNRIQQACYPNNGNFTSNEACMNQMKLIAFDRCKDKDPSMRSFNSCSAKVPSPNPKSMPVCSEYINKNAKAYFDKFAMTYNINDNFRKFAKDNALVDKEFSDGNCLPV